MAQLVGVDHVLTDPPYEPEGHANQRRTTPGPGWGVRNSELDFDPITDDLRTQSSGLMAKLAKRWTLVFCQAEGAMLWRAALEKGGAVYKRSMVWIKPNAMPQYSGDRPAMGYETVIACHARGKSRWNGGGRHGVFTYNKTDGSEHQTQKPLALMNQLITLFTDEGETILDPFCGSGSTLRSAKDLNRKAIGIETDEKLCALAARRMAQTVFNFNSKQIMAG